MSLSWLTPSAELIGPIVEMAFPWVVFTATAEVYSCSVDHPSLQVCVVEPPNSPRKPPDVVEVLVPLELEFINVIELADPTSAVLL